MIDIHAHILPGVDDGSESMKMSLDMLDMAHHSGVTAIAATPHSNIPGEFSNHASADLKTTLDELRIEAKTAGIPITICQGMEVYTTESVPELVREKKLWTLNRSRYMLMEFAFDEDPEFCREILKEIRNMNIHPIIAHPERYFFVQDDPQIAYEWCTSGYALQVNKGSLLGSFGSEPERTSRLILGHGLAACVASDAHSTYQRTTHMGEVSRFLREEFGEEYRDLMLKVNPGRILKNQQLMGYRPQPF